MAELVSGVRVMPRGYASLADYYRAHNEAMKLAMATGCTPKEAERELRRQAREKRARCGTPARWPGQAADTAAPPPLARGERSPSPSQVDGEDRGFREWDSPWMMRD
jgi:hypothetical protein